MARVSAPSSGGKIASSWGNDLRLDYLSQTDTNPQTIAGDLTVAGSFTFGGRGLATGTSPITVVHGLTDVTSANTVVLLTPMGAQPSYRCSYSIDATNITIYHNAAASLTVSWHAFKI